MAGRVTEGRAPSTPSRKAWARAAWLSGIPGANGVLALVEGRYSQADRLHAAAAASNKDLGERSREQVAMSNVGVASFRSGNFARAMQSAGDHESALRAFLDMEGEGRQGIPSRLFMVPPGLPAARFAGGVKGVVLGAVGVTKAGARPAGFRESPPCRHGYLLQADGGRAREEAHHEGGL